MNPRRQLYCLYLVLVPVEYLGFVDICGVDLFFVNLTRKQDVCERQIRSRRTYLSVKLTKNKSTPQMSTNPSLNGRQKSEIEPAYVTYFYDEKME